MATKVRQLDSKQRRVFWRVLKKWFSQNAREFPWRRSTDPFEILVAEFLLQRTHSGKVVKVYGDFIRRFGSPAGVAHARVSELSALLRPLGLIKRARVLKKIASTLLLHHMGNVPSDREELLALSGVGPYTAAAIRCFAFAEREAIVDGSIVRLLTRFFGLPTSTKGANVAVVEVQAARECLPTTDVREYNWALLDHAALICRKRKPLCEICPLAVYCKWWSVHRLDHQGQGESGRIRKRKHTGTEPRADRPRIPKRSLAHHDG